MVWDDGLLQAADGAMRELREAIADCGAERILTRCGRRQAIDVGQPMGIELFQGWSGRPGQPGLVLPAGLQ